MFTVQASRPLRAALTVAAFTAALMSNGPAAAQASQPGSAAPVTKRDPLNAAERVPTVQHRSALASYRAHAEQPVGSWREANDTVTKIGGWRAYAREASQPDASAPMPPSAPPPVAPVAKPAATQPAPAGHAGHGKP